MARIDGIIILSPNGYVPRLSCTYRLTPPSKPLISSHFPFQPPSYASVHIDTFNHLLRKAQGELDPVLWVSGLTGAALCHVEKEGLRFLCPISQEGTSRARYRERMLMMKEYSQSVIRICIPRYLHWDVGGLSGRYNRSFHKG
jgi:hypothetical protein